LAAAAAAVAELGQANLLWSIHRVRILRVKPSVPVSASLFTQFDSIVDARSPAEYAEDHIPGAVSAPALDDAERATVGTLYKQVSPFDARKLGAALLAKNVARHVETLFRGKDSHWRPLVYCWRGGQRSGAMAHIMREIGWDSKTLEGGYRAYRRWVVQELQRLPPHFRLVVIHGPTGSGKSRYLKNLQRSGEQVLDLEELAAHRGSVLGNLPGRPQPSQKWFESQLLAALSALDPARTVYVEGESRKIGQVQVPEALISRMRASPCILLETDLETRVTLLLEEQGDPGLDRKSTRLNSSHVSISYAVFCLKKKKNNRVWLEYIYTITVELKNLLYT